MLGLTNAAGPSRQALAATTAQEMASTYSQRFNDFYRYELHELVPLPLTLDGTAAPPADLPGLLGTARHLQLVGPSGSGKSHLAKHTVLALPENRWLTIFVDAGMYEGRLSSLINRSVARFSTSTSDDLLRAAGINGQTVLLVVDGYNECPQRLQERLDGDLGAFGRRTKPATLITSQARVRVSDAIDGAVIHIGQLDDESRKAVLTSYGAPEIVDLSEPFSTAYELSIAAECAGELKSPVTRAALFSAFVRKRLSGASSPAATRETLRCLALVMDDKLATSLALDEVWRVAEQYLADRSVPATVIDNVLNSTFTVSQQGRFSFTHELLGRFLAAEALTLQHRQSTELALELSKPRHQDLLQLAVELETDTSQADELLAGLADWFLYVRAIRGEAGGPATHAAQATAHRLLQTVTEAMSDTTFVVRGQFDLSVTGGHALSKADQALLSAIGLLVSYGEYFPEVILLLDATDAACWRSMEAAQGETHRLTASEVVSAVLFGGSAGSQVAAHVVLEAARLARHDSWLRSPADMQRVSLERLASLMDGATRRSYARLFLLCELLQQARGLEAAALAARVLRLCWASAAYHLRLDGLQMIQSFAAEVRGQPVCEDIVGVLEELNTKNVMLSSQLVETLYSYDLIEPQDDNDFVQSQIEEIFRSPEADESRQWAYTIVSYQFEDVIAAPYITAVEALSADQRTTLYTLAALGSPSYGFWNDWLLRELINSGDRRALPAFERWATQLYTDNPMFQEVVSSYTLAIRGWAQFMESPPRLINDQSDERAAWECYGAIIFWLYRPGLSTEDIAGRCELYWQRLRGELLPAAADPLYWFMHANHIRLNDDPPLIGLIAQSFPVEVRSIVEWSLEHRDSLLSIFTAGMSSDRPEYLIDILGVVGNAKTVELLRNYVDDPALGRSAIGAIRRLTGKQA